MKMAAFLLLCVAHVPAGLWRGSNSASHSLAFEIWSYPGATEALGSAARDEIPLE